MIPAFENAIHQINEGRRFFTGLAQDSAYDKAELPERLLGLDRKETVYRFIADMDAVTDYEERCRLLDALYVYTRQKAQHERGLVLGSGTSLPTDTFEVARFLWFSVPQWWKEATGDISTELLDPVRPPEPAWEDIISGKAHSVYPRYAPQTVCIQPGTIIQRSENILDGSRYQSFDTNLYASLTMVIRQWVEEEDDNFANALGSSAEWQRLLSLKPEVYHFGWNERGALQSAGLPCTPSVQSFLSQERDKLYDPITIAHGGLPASRPPAIPRRGGLVTTFVFTAYKFHPENSDQYVRHVWLVQQTTSVAKWVTCEFWNRARKCLADHEEWVETLNLGAMPGPVFTHGPGKGPPIKYPETRNTVAELVAKGQELSGYKSKLLAKLTEEMKAKGVDPTLNTVSAGLDSIIQNIRRSYGS